MKPKIVVSLTWLVVTFSFVPGASAQTYTWSGAGDGTTWSQGTNWVGGVPPPPGATQVSLDTGSPTTTPAPITIGAPDLVQVDGSIIGPVWGETLNIYGTVYVSFALEALGAITGPKSTVNLFGHGSLTSGDSIFLGDVFWFPGGPHVEMNLYDNSSVTTKNLMLGGHLNIFSGTVTVTNGLFTGTATGPVFPGGLDRDATRLIDIDAGKLVVAGDITVQANDLIARGILEGYGGTGQIVIDTLSDPGFTIITAVPEPGTLPQFTGITVSGTDLNLSGSNVLAGRYVLVVSTNLNATPAQWTVVMTNTFAGETGFSVTVTNGFSADVAAQFYRYRTP